MASTRISRKSVAALQRGQWITDDLIPGFKCRRPNRHALYGLNIRLQGRMRWISLGTEAELTPDQARAEAERVRGLKRQGENPATQRDKRKSAETVVERFMAEHVRPKLKAQTVRQYSRVLNTLFLARFDNWQLDAISQSDLAQWHIALGGAPVQANRALTIVSSLMAWAKSTKLRADNPCHGIPRYRERKILRYLNLSEIAQIARAVDELQAEGKLSVFYAAALKVLMLTGARRGEIFEAQWGWLDTERGELVLPDSKTDAKVISLPQAALEIIAALPRLHGCPWIFPSPKTGRAYANYRHGWGLVLARAGIGHWRLHDLRHGIPAGLPCDSIG